MALGALLDSLISISGEGDAYRDSGKIWKTAGYLVERLDLGGFADMDLDYLNRRIRKLARLLDREAEELLAGANWLPEPLRTQGHVAQTTDDPTATENIGVEETATSDGETAMDEAALEEESDQASDADPFGVAAE